MAATPRTALPAASFLAFAAFGAFWGAWGASVPRVQDQAGVGDGELGVALLFVGAGALPAMLLTGRALDRFGLRVAAGLIAALGLAGAVLAVVAVDVVTLSAALALVGATSGAADVAMNSVAGRAESEAGRPVITRAHGVFSAAVVVTTLLTGAAAAADLAVAVPFLVVAALSVVAGARLLVVLPGRAAPGRPGRRRPGPPAPGRPWCRCCWSASSARSPSRARTPTRAGARSSRPTSWAPRRRSRRWRPPRSPSPSP